MNSAGLCVLFCAFVCLCVTVDVLHDCVNTQGMQAMYNKCHLVHADLSEYNLLWHRGRVVFIDVSQSVEPSHPNGLEFLLRDCRNMSAFFERVGVRDVMTAHQLFNHVSGLKITASNDSDFIAQVSRSC